jgi:hypothetical protein
MRSSVGRWDLNQRHTATRWHCLWKADTVAKSWYTNYCRSLSYGTEAGLCILHVGRWISNRNSVIYRGYAHRWRIVRWSRRFGRIRHLFIKGKVKFVPVHWGTLIWRHMENAVIAPYFLSLFTEQKWVINFPQSCDFTSRKSLCSHWIVGSVGYKDGLEEVVKRTVSCPAENQTAVVQSVA